MSDTKKNYLEIGPAVLPYSGFILVSSEVFNWASAQYPDAFMALNNILVRNMETVANVLYKEGKDSGILEDTIDDTVYKIAYTIKPDNSENIYDFVVTFERMAGIYKKNVDLL